MYEQVKRAAALLAAGAAFSSGAWGQAALVRWVNDSNTMAALEDQVRGAPVDVSIDILRRTSGPFPGVIGKTGGPDQDAEPVTVYQLAPAVEVALLEGVHGYGAGEEVGLVDLMDRKAVASAYIEGFGSPATANDLAISFLSVAMEAVEAATWGPGAVGRSGNNPEAQIIYVTDGAGIRTRTQ